MKNCPKCKGKMEAGYLTVGYRGRITVNKKGAGVSGRPKTISYSCEKCGFVEVYLDQK